jgi:magnesium transporter
MTVLSGIFLPLNLVVGFFGMNTQNLFFSKDASGTLYVVYILGALLSLALVAFPLFSFLERYILRKILGRIRIYRNLVENIKKLTHLD